MREKKKVGLFFPPELSASLPETLSTVGCVSLHLSLSLSLFLSSPLSFFLLFPLLLSPSVLTFSVSSLSLSLSLP